MKIRNLGLALIPCAFLAGMLLAGTAVAQQDLDTAETAASEPGAEESARPECVRVTGSRICRDPDSVKMAGRTLNTANNVTVYGREDLFTTGQPTVGGALRQLDPRLR